MIIDYKVSAIYILIVKALWILSYEIVKFIERLMVKG